MINSIWESSEGKKFQILSIKDNQVYYQNIETKKTYNCSLEYFKSKFWNNINVKR